MLPVEEIQKIQEIQALGYKAFVEGDNVKALQMYDEAIRLSPNAIFYTNRTQCHIRLGNWSDALSDIEEGLKLNPDNFSKCGLLHYKGIVYRNMGEFKNARLTLEEAMKFSIPQQVPELRHSIESVAHAWIASIGNTGVPPPKPNKEPKNKSQPTDHMPSFEFACVNLPPCYKQFERSGIDFEVFYIFIDASAMQSMVYPLSDWPSVVLGYLTELSRFSNYQQAVESVPQRKIADLLRNVRKLNKPEVLAQFEKYLCP